jgi:serine phosphatase RsbU (regulator of sigma subunit)
MNRHSIRWRLLIIMLSLLITLLVTLTYIQIQSQQFILERELGHREALMREKTLKRGETFSNNLAQQAAIEIAAFDFYQLTEVIHSIVKEEPDLIYGILMDADQMIHIHTKQPELEMEIGTAPSDLFAIAQAEPTQQILKLNSTEIVEFISPIQISTQPWGVLRLGFSMANVAVEIAQSQQEINKQIQWIVIKSIITAIIFLIIGFIIIFIISTKISKPLIKLTHSAHELAMGNFSTEILVQKNAPDEVNVLATAFANMAKKLQHSYEQLEKYNLSLEYLVEERTTQLVEANKEITALNKQLQSENLRMSAELEVSKQLQEMLLPKEDELSQIEDLDIAGFMEPADEVGGDYYDVQQRGDRVLCSIGDVTGHGLESGVLAIMTQTAVRTLLANNETDSTKFLTALNETIYHNVQRMKADKNLTFALLDYQYGQVRLSGQHEEMIVVRQGNLELIDTIDLGFPIGLVENIAEWIAETTVVLNQGDVIVLYTDGITEAFNPEKVEYGIERLCEIVKKNWQRTADEIKQAVIDDVKQYISTQKVFDDITLLVLKQK